MGEFKFRIPEFWQLEPDSTRTVHVVGLDGIPKPCSVKLIDNLLIISRNQNESGRTYIAYPFSNHGELTICTGTLPESSQPYRLVTELARGTVNRLRNQTSIWDEGGLTIPIRVEQLTGKAIENLSQAIISNDAEGDIAAHDALEYAMEAVFALSAQFGTEISEFRISHEEIPPFWLAISRCGEAANCGDERLFDLIESDRIGESGTDTQKSIFGPILDASPMSTFSSGDLSFAERRDALLERCREQLPDMSSASLIHAACGLNGTGHQRLAYRQQIQLTTDILNLIDGNDSERPVLVSFDNPWGERLAWSVGGIHPLQIADDLMRNGSRISFLGLDVNMDYWPSGCVSRDPLQWIDIFDIWCQFGLPLVLCVRVPQTVAKKTTDVESEYRSESRDDVTVQTGSFQSANEVATELEKPVIENAIRNNLSSQQRLNLIRTILPMAVARPGLHGIIWRQWSDVDDPRFPHAGLIDEFGEMKPIGQMIEELRRDILKR